MKITLHAAPPDVPGYAKIVAEDGQSRVVQRDYEFYSVARDFGFDISKVVNVFAPKCDHIYARMGHDCPDCGFAGGSFIHAARAWIAAHDGETIDDCGYFARRPADYGRERGQKWRTRLSLKKLALAHRYDSTCYITLKRFKELLASDAVAKRVASYVIKLIDKEAKKSSTAFARVTIPSLSRSEAWRRWEGCNSGC